MEISNKIIIMKREDVIPYEKNPRNNDAAVAYVANSIREFGFRNPIIIDANNVIVAGHTRLKAAEQLGLDEVPCIKAEDMSEEQIKAFRLADNKTAEVAEWDLELLGEELADILDIDMSDFGFEVDVIVDIPKESKDDAEPLETQRYIEFGSHKVPISDEEFESLEERLNTYSEQYGTQYGFINNLLGGV